MNEQRVLQYNGIRYLRYIIDRGGNLFLRLKKGLRPVKKHLRGDGYLAFNVRHPVTGKRCWIMAHRAAHESFNGFKGKDVQACHRHGTKPGDFHVGACEWGSAKKNRHDRRRDGTSTTGNNTRPGKLKNHVWDIIYWYEDGGTVREIASYFRSTRAAVNRWLKRYECK